MSVSLASPGMDRYCQEVWPRLLLSMLRKTQSNSEATPRRTTSLKFRACFKATTPRFCRLLNRIRSALPHRSWLANAGCMQWRRQLIEKYFDRGFVAHARTAGNGIEEIISDSFRRPVLPLQAPTFYCCPPSSDAEYFHRDCSANTLTRRARNWPLGSDQARIWPFLLQLSHHRSTKESRSLNFL